MQTSRTQRIGLFPRLAVMLALAANVLSAPAACACPFCNAAMQTLSQEIAAADVALIAELVEPMPTSGPDGGVGEELPAAKFRVVEVLHGDEKLAGAKEISVVYFGEEAPNKKFMITGLAGVTGPGLDWTTPVPLSETAVSYVKKLATVPAAGADRLAFFQEYLENDDPLLAQDSYDEFARTPYADVTALGPRMKRDKILEWINDPSVGPSGRRLYLTMLGVCGKPEDVAMLETLMNYDYATMKPAIAAAAAAGIVSGPAIGLGLLDEVLHAEERRKRESLDALIACYIRLKGPDALELIDRLFLANPNVEFKHLHSAIMALRFHGEETDVLPRERLIQSMRLALDHRDFADQVIPDLTRWEDWDVMPRLVKMFKDSPKDDWIRQPVATYLLVAADAEGGVGQKATQEIEELEKLDPETIERARKLSEFGFLARAAAAPAAAASTTRGDSTPAATATDISVDPGAGATTVENAVSTADEAASAVTVDDSQAETAASQVDDAPVPGVPQENGEKTDQIAAASPETAAGASRPSPAPPIATTLAPPSKIKIIGIPLLAVVVLLAVFAVLLRGADPRSSDENP